MSQFKNLYVQNEVNMNCATFISALQPNLLIDTAESLSNIFFSSSSSYYSSSRTTGARIFLMW